MPAPRVCAVVVTHNRRALLTECLDALRAQTRSLDEVVVVDNASTDDTPGLLAATADVRALRLDHNGGSAGGFHAGVSAALEGDADWLWVMDDDTVPEPGALEALLDGLERAEGLPEPAVLASRVLWTDGALHPMNEPWPRWGDKRLEVGAVERRLLAIRAISYVSILVRRDAIEAHGLPKPELFIWGDDIEWTARLLKDEIGYLVPQSVVLHKTAHPHSPNRSKGDRYFYDVRNKVLMLRGDVWRTTERFWFAVLMLYGIREHLAYNRFSVGSVRTVLRGLRAGLLSPLPALPAAAPRRAVPAGSSTRPSATSG